MLRRMFLSLVLSIGAVGFIPSCSQAAVFQIVSLYPQSNGSLQVEVQWYGYLLDTIQAFDYDTWSDSFYSVPYQDQTYGVHYAYLYIRSGTWFSGDTIQVFGYHNDQEVVMTSDPAP